MEKAKRFFNFLISYCKSSKKEPTEIKYKVKPPLPKKNKRILNNTQKALLTEIKIQKYKNRLEEIQKEIEIKYIQTKQEPKDLENLKESINEIEQVFNYLIHLQKELSDLEWHKLTYEVFKNDYINRLNRNKLKLEKLIKLYNYKYNKSKEYLNLYHTFINIIFTPWDLKYSYENLFRFNIKLKDYSSSYYSDCLNLWNIFCEKQEWSKNIEDLKYIYSFKLSYNFPYYKKMCYNL